MEHDIITLAAGAGGKISQSLLSEVILPAFGEAVLPQFHDGAVLEMGERLAFTTDSYVVSPRFFPGGNIGKLAVCGTVNDLAMTGAVPKYLSVGAIIEEGLPIDELRMILETMRETALEAGVRIATGDTKVVGKGGVDGIFINTAGIGVVEGKEMDPRAVTAGLDVIVSGTLGDHSATILAKRHGIEVEDDLQSDCAPLANLAADMRRAAPSIPVMRDATRGGAAAVLNEIAEAADVGILLEEELLPVRESVEGIAELLGIEPLALANEGKLIAFCDPSETAALLSAMHASPYGKDACRIGRTTTESPGLVAMKTGFGGVRIVEMPLGDIVPRIC
ncbi:hydrogenase expression/formation protein HypE [Selenomonas sp. TAMA-11512]|uniref:hydrogenase expression/formation protein HypE n=1 Tax=Selenomonas sp. TAMA-11512 TaxID=3095337 RepID=UPI00308CE91A|nr:hydrogenase expression/formation protein HypE [Selenomonas sp. TAMA-11512]